MSGQSPRRSLESIHGPPPRSSLFSRCNKPPALGLGAGQRIYFSLARANPPLWWQVAGGQAKREASRTRRRRSSGRGRVGRRSRLPGSASTCGADCTHGEQPKSSSRAERSRAAVPDVKGKASADWHRKEKKPPGAQDLLSRYLGRVVAACRPENGLRRQDVCPPRQASVGLINNAG